MPEDEAIIIAMYNSFFLDKCSNSYNFVNKNIQINYNHSKHLNEKNYLNSFILCIMFQCDER